MQPRVKHYLINALSVTALVLSLAAVQSPLWRPVLGTPCFTAKTGGIVFFDYGREIEKATILQSHTASLSAVGPHQLAIHAHAPGHTRMLIKYKDGERKLYDVVVLPG